MKEFINILNLISLAAAIISVIMMCVLGWFRPSLVKRVSIQLQTGIALLDITRHLQLHNLFATENTALCTTIAFYGFFSDQLYIFLNVAIALNLYLLLLKKIQPKSFLKWVYWAASVGISFSINLAPLTLGYFGKSNWGGLCYLTENIPNRLLLKFFIIHLVLWPGVIYCLIISTFILYRCCFKSSHIKDNTIYSQPEFRRLSWTIALYPLTCFMTMIFYLILHSISDWLNHFSMPLLRISKVALRSTGLLNMLCMLVDRQVWHTMKSIFNPENEAAKSINLELSVQTPVKKTKQVNTSHVVDIFAPYYPVDDLDYEQEPLIVFL